jgi:hypothetical protein
MAMRAVIDSNFDAVVKLEIIELLMEKHSLALWEEKQEQKQEQKKKEEEKNAESV